MIPWEDKFARVQDKGLRIVVLNTNNYVGKVEQQINRSSFDKLNSDPSSEFKQEVIDWIDMWSNKINENWKEFVKPGNWKAGKMYGMVETHKNDNPACVITSGCNTAVENLSILVEKILYPIADKLPSKIKDTDDMLNIIDSINGSVLADKHVLVSFDVVNMFPNIDNKSGLKSVKDVLLDNKFDLDSTQCVADALEICLNCNNSKLNLQTFLQKDGTAQGPYMSCSYVDIAMVKYDSLANKFHLRPRFWKRFRDDVFVLWEHDIASLPLFFSYLNSMNATEQVRSTLLWKLQVTKA